jgi:2-polyprenyl-3-methyl-5-hydroxy-6-metoxy-1,4-benzoquinol methylase
LNDLQKLIYNNGERLVPYLSHDEDELIRHRSSYAFFYAVIASDLQRSATPDSQFSIADLGFGSGYGCAFLSSLPASQITGIDIGSECEKFARKYYARDNVKYVIKDLRHFIPEAESFDYVVSRGVLEHVPGGLGLIEAIKFRRRVMIDVPYNEASGNEHHLLTGIKEDAFIGLKDCEFFYEDLQGRIFDAENKPENSNMIMVVISEPNLPKVASTFHFPIDPVRDANLEKLGGIRAAEGQFYFETVPELLMAVGKIVRGTEVVLDVGCGIVPMNYFRPKLHLMVEPWKEYSDILSYRYSGDKSVIIIRTGAIEALRQLADDSVDSIFMLDVIEHLEKEIGRQVIIECERVAREQIVIFTPLGFMPQHMESEQTDGWGLGGSTVQEHRSGWDLEDFSTAWSLYICESFHEVNFKGEALANPHGAFYAIRDLKGKIRTTPEKMSDIRRLLPSEIELQSLTGSYEEKLNIANQERDDYKRRLTVATEDSSRQRAISDELRNEYNRLLQTRPLRLSRWLRKILRIAGVR